MQHVLATESMTTLSVPGKFKRLAVVAIAGLLIVPFCPAVQSPPSVFFLEESFSEKQDDASEAHLQRGLQQAKAGDLQSAEEELRAAVSLQPNNAEFLSSLATVLAMQKKFQESSSLFEKALKINPADWRSREYLAANLWQLHRYAEAKQNLRILLNTNPADGQAKLLLGLVSEKERGLRYGGGDARSRPRSGSRPTGGYCRTRKILLPHRGARQGGSWPPPVG